MSGRREFRSALAGELGMFAEHCRASYAEKTSDAYLMRMQSLDEHLLGLGFGGGSLTEEVLDGWIATLRGRREFTIGGYVTALRAFLRFRAGLGAADYIPPARRRAYDYAPYVFSDDEVARICEIADSYEVASHNRLPYIRLELPMAIRVLCGCGTRLGETLAIKMADVDVARHVITMRAAKGGKERLVPMHRHLGEILERYCAAMGLVGLPDAFLFPRLNLYEPLEQFDMRNRFNTILRLAGIRLEGRTFQERGPCMHCLRHRFVMKAFKQLEASGTRVDDAVPVLSIYLGHYDLTETEKYMKFSAEMFPEEMERFESFSKGLFPDVEGGAR